MRHRRLLPGLLLGLGLLPLPALVPLGPLPLGPRPALGQPKLPPPTLQRVLAGSVVGSARVRWSKLAPGSGARIEVSIGVGAAERQNPAWSPEPVRLRYDLNQNRDVERELKRAHLPATTTAPPPGPADRTLELLARGQEGWVVVGAWTFSEARWRKQHGALFRLLEPLFEAPAEPFVPVKK